MWLQQRYIELAQRSGEIGFSLYGRVVDAMAEGMAHFKYLVRTLDQYGDDWPAILCNLRMAQKVWDWMVKILQQ